MGPIERQLRELLEAGPIERRTLERQLGPMAAVHLAGWLRRGVVREERGLLVAVTRPAPARSPWAVERDRQLAARLAETAARQAALDVETQRLAEQKRERDELRARLAAAKTPAEIECISRESRLLALWRRLAALIVPIDPAELPRLGELHGIDLQPN